MGQPEAVTVTWGDPNRRFPLGSYEAVGQPAASRYSKLGEGKNELKFLKSIRREWFNSFGKPRNHAWILPTMGCQ